MSILIVDDSADNRLLIRAILEENGFNAIICASGAAEAYGILGLNGGPQPLETPELILMDIMMPKISGIEAVRRIRAYERFRRLPIIMVTARQRGQSLSEAFDAGATDYITKPVDEFELIARVSAALTLKCEMDARLERESELTRLKDELLAKNEHLANLLEIMKKDLSAARELQRSLLPPVSPSLPGFEAAWHYEPCTSIGGDLLNIFRFDKRFAGTYVLDVSGHGISAALLSVALSHILTNWGREGNILLNSSGEVRPPAELISLLNRQFTTSAANFEGNPQYFTILYGLLDFQRRTFRWVRAGHPPLIRVSRQGELTSFQDGDVPVGLDNNARFREEGLHLETGDRLFLYSDGITETKHSISKELYGELRLQQLIIDLRDLPIHDVTKRIIAEIATWRGTNTPQDDLTLLIIEANDN
ncbi:MAG: fused response regulator/phosphatase [Candidatus Riflebacteria bacterium]|nr:fused response regulator/phosphatase [Candidatus Riflebacteria bacterium]